MWIGILGGAVVATASSSLWLLPRGEALAVSAAAVAVFVGFVARGMFSVRSSVLVRTHWRSDDADETRLALTFDDGPHPQWTPQVLEILRRHGVRATFFVIGENARRHPELVRRLVEEGHEVGCHGDQHAWTTPFFPKDKLDADIARCREAIRAAAGVTPRLYRPPIGIRSPGHVGVGDRNDLLVIGMARRGLDGRAHEDPQAFARRVVAEAEGGEILALHDGEEPLHPASRAGTVAALPQVLEGLTQRGLAPVPVSALLAERPYLETPSRGWTGRSRGGRLGMAIFRLTARAFGHRGCLAVAPLVAGWFVATHPKARRASIDLRRRLHGRAGTLRELGWVFRHFLVFGRTIVDRMAFLHAGAETPRFEIVNYEAVRSVVEAEAGFLFVSAHVGDWIAASRICRLGPKRPMWVVAAQGMGVGPHQVSRAAGRQLFQAIDVDGHPVAVAAEIAAALREGGVVSMLGDRKVNSDVVRVPFLGGEAEFPTGPWTVALVTGAPAVVFFMVRMPDGHHRLELAGVIRVPKGAREDRAAAIRQGAMQFAAHLEEVVRRHPYHWSNFYPFWTT